VKVELVKIDALDLDPRNARKHDAKNLKAIADSLEQFGQRKPIVVWGRTVVAGNGTMAAARTLGWTEIEIVRVPDDWSADQVKAYALADNRSAELAAWDEQVLASQLLELQEAEFDIELLGFELPTDELQDVVEDEMPEQVEPKSKLGDVWKLGRHRLICGDSTDTATMLKLMNGSKAELVLTDPPYKINNSKDSGVFQETMKNSKTRVEPLSNFEPQDFLKILPTFFAKGLNAYIFTSKELVPDYLNWAKDNNYNFNILTWHKTQHIPFTNFTHYPDTEYLIYIAKNPVWNTGLGNYKKYWILNNEKSVDHPTIKPLEILVDEIKISSNPNGIVVDLFGGSGSTLLACEQTNRNCYMSELDPKYVDVIIARWEKLTGQTAELIEG
jgi:site-specific DNA-methyltransferase (adenine-specific)